MVYVVQGLLGSGKSYDCTRLAIDHFLHGGVVASNMHFDPVAIGRAYGRICNASQYVHVTAATPPSVIPSGDARGRGGRRVMVILDEALNWFDSGASKDEDKRASWGSWLRQSDKLGQDVYFIAQQFARAAKWIRELAAYMVDIQNMRDFRFFFGLIRLSSIVPIFNHCYIRRQMDIRAKSLASLGVYFRRASVWRHYDTAETFGFQKSDNAYSSFTPLPPAKLQVLPCLMIALLCLLLCVAS